MKFGVTSRKPNHNRLPTIKLGNQWSFLLIFVSALISFTKKLLWPAHYLRLNIIIFIVYVDYITLNKVKTIWFKLYAFVEVDMIITRRIITLKIRIGELFAFILKIFLDSKRVGLFVRKVQMTYNQTNHKDFLGSLAKYKK